MKSNQNVMSIFPPICYPAFFVAAIQIHTVQLEPNNLLKDTFTFVIAAKCYFLKIFSVL